jgi:signal transduction histidine kinase
MPSSKTDYIADDIASIQRIDAVPAILEVICRTTGMGFAAVARVTEERWIACAVRDEIAFGLKAGGELQLETTICSEIRFQQEPIVIDHVSANPRWRDHHTPKLYGFESYISLPIFRADKSMWGTLCAIDPKPAHVERPEIINMFRLFGDLIGSHLDTQDRLAASEAALLSERQAAELREQFIAVLGHDLRNPLAAIDAGVRLLERPGGEAQAAMVRASMRSSVGRMTELIANVLDLARARLGGGLQLNRALGANLEPALEHVVAELRSGQPDRKIETEFSLAQPVPADAARIGQMLSNLVANALTHGDSAAPVKVRAAATPEAFELSVSNTGAPIPPETMERLFQPFFRAGVARPGDGLGLGLYIASEIARAHGGELNASSTADETRFTFRMPLGGLAPTT